MVRNWYKIENIAHDLSGGDYTIKLSNTFSGPGIIQADITSLNTGTIAVKGAAFPDATIAQHSTYTTINLTDGTGVSGGFVDLNFNVASCTLVVSATAGTLNTLYIADGTWGK